jgi:hypothetical protein
MVDAEPAVQRQDLLRDLFRRPDNEPVADQCLELLIKASVIVGQVLTPRVIRLILRAQVGSAQADNLARVFATKTSRRIGSSSGNGLPAASSARL